MAHKKEKDGSSDGFINGGGLRLDLVGIVDQGAHPVGLAAFGAGGGHTPNDLTPALSGNDYRGDRFAAWR